MMYFKDDSLAALARSGNVAQFVSWAPDGSQRHSAVRGLPLDSQCGGVAEGLAELLASSPEGTVNVRSFDPTSPKGDPLAYGLKSVAEAAAEVERRLSEGKHVIANETVDVADGGVSGVALGDSLEFAPAATPKCVEEPGVCALPQGVGLSILHTVYGIEPALPAEPTDRVEWSIHPVPRGYRGGHILLWEREDGQTPVPAPEIRWPNRFSRWLGDKVFGLLIADELGCPVPHTTVISRRIAPFSFGLLTGSPRRWMRTCPEVSEPGLYATYDHWRDPWKVVSAEEIFAPEGAAPIASVISQAGVPPMWSGSVVPDASGSPLVQGVSGSGDGFMVGESAPCCLPGRIASDAADLWRHAANQIGPCAMEWVHDGSEAWCVQLRCSPSGNGPAPPVPGITYARLDTADGLPALRTLLAQEPEGVCLVGDVGVTSHFGDLLRASGLPWYIERPA